MVVVFGLPFLREIPPGRHDEMQIFPARVVGGGSPLFSAISFLKFSILFCFNCCYCCFSLMYIIFNLRSLIPFHIHVHTESNGTTLTKYKYTRAEAKADSGSSGCSRDIIKSFSFQSRREGNMLLQVLQLFCRKISYTATQNGRMERRK